MSDGELLAGLAAELAPSSTGVLRPLTEGATMKQDPTRPKGRRAAQAPINPFTWHKLVDLAPMVGSFPASALRAAVAAGDLVGIKINGSWYSRQADVEDWLLAKATGTLKPKPNPVIEAAIAKLIADAPPLDEDQVAQLRALVRGGSGS